MNNVSKFMENELDRIDNYLSMASSNLVVVSELCENRCENIASSLSEIDFKVFNYLDKELSLLDAHILSAKDIISKFKNFYYCIGNVNNVEEPFIKTLPLDRD